MNEASKRLEYLISAEGVSILQNSCVMVVGVGGVGGFAVEALARSFVGKLILVDMDTVAESNLNRQIIALTTTLNRPKVEVMKERIAQINPECEVVIYQGFYKKGSCTYLNENVDFVVDAIDILTSKMDLIEECKEKGIPMISSLGMGNRLDPSKLSVTTLEKTSYDPLAKALRGIVKKRGFRGKIPVVFSSEIPVRQSFVENREGKTRKEVLPPSSSAFVPSAAGLLCASYVVRKLIEKRN